MKNVVVTNGPFPEETLLGVLSYIDAMNVDLKSFSKDLYREIGGSLDIVQRSIQRAAQGCHVTRFFPRYKMEHACPAPVGDVQRLAQTARRELENVFIGNC